MANRGLRYSSTAVMPNGLRESAERALGRMVTPPEEKADAVRTKYSNQPTTVDGIRFDSKREAEYYKRLVLEKKAGIVSYFLRQVPLHLPGGTKYVVDFLVVMADGSIRFVDPKGRETQVFKVKRREVQAVYPIKIETV